MAKIFLALCTAFLVACSATSKTEPVNDASKHPSETSQKRMASDMATKLAGLYPPARSKLIFRSAPSDAFGISLLSALRKQGYAVAESRPTSAGSAGTKPANAGELSLSYIVDRPLDAELIRVTIFLNAQSLSRLYEVNERGAAPAGYWIRKE